MERKQQFRARIKNINYDYVEDLMIRNDYKNIGETLDIIIKEHEELNDKDWDLEYISDRVATRVNQTFEKELTKIRLGTNNVDRNTQILIELLQGFMQFDDCDAIFTTEMKKSKRGKKIFIDYLRNAYGQTSVSPFSLRAIESAGVATPVEWTELNNLTSASQFTFQNIFRRMGQKKQIN